ncbi:MAG TPA: helix-turn-helix transcriptional regulator [Terriglobales bacterium]|nr:helix-turn-helix transcriptional regulator [Terriglobales bacterium]
MLHPGQQLRLFREKLGLTMRDVELASAAIAAKHGNDDFSVPLSRLSDIETKGVVPSVFRMYALAVIYRCELNQILAWYGIDMNEVASDLKVVSPPKSHKADALQAATQVRIPVRLDPGFDQRRTANLGRMVEQWGLVPLAYLEQFAQTSYTYGYIGTEDLTMYPLLPPGSFVQIDESKNKVIRGVWHSEYERPIYFVETRAGHTCCWCTMKGSDHIVLQPHPLSPLQIRVLRHPQDAEVIGQVVGVAMRLGEWRAAESVPEPKAREALN